MKFSKRNKVLFIIHDVLQDDNDFPLGPAYLAAMLHKNGGFVEAYCMDVYHYTNKDLADHLDNNSYDLIGVGFLAARYKKTVLPLCKVINNHKKKAWLVLGGHGPSPIPKYMLRDTKADIVVIGEAEETIIELLEAKIKGKSLKRIKGIAYREKGGNIRVNERREPIKDLDSIPVPLYEIFPMNKYSACMKMFGMKKGERSLGILSSRGCYGNCSFCVSGDTKITTNNGIKDIKDLMVGDIIKGYDIKTKEIKDTTINKLHKRKGNYYKVMTKEGDELKVSGEHPIFTKRGWIEVKDLKIGDSVLLKPKII